LIKDILSKSNNSSKDFISLPKGAKYSMNPFISFSASSFCPSSFLSSFTFFCSSSRNI
jgi:hypothetical protein